MANSFSANGIKRSSRLEKKYTTQDGLLTMLVPAEFRQATVSSPPRKKKKIDRQSFNGKKSLRPTVKVITGPYKKQQQTIAHRLLPERQKLPDRLNLISVGGKECKLCGSVLSSKAALMSHEKKHYRRTNLYCPYCRRYIPEPTLYREHWSEMHSDKVENHFGGVIQWSICVACGAEVEDLRDHAEKRHREGEFLVCCSCLARWTDVDDWIEHCGACMVKEEIKEEPWSPPPSPKLVAEEELWIKQEPEEMDFSLAFLVDAAKHDHTYERMDGPVECLLCDETTESLFEYRLHMQEQHYNINQFFCPRCSAYFFHIDELEQHALVHNPGRHRCVVCVRIFPDNDALMTHLVDEHETIGVRCALCLHVAVDKAMAVCHFHAEHHIVKCVRCQRTYENGDAMALHQRFCKFPRRNENDEVLFPPTTVDYDSDMSLGSSLDGDNDVDAPSQPLEPSIAAKATSDGSAPAFDEMELKQRLDLPLDATIEYVNGGYGVRNPFALVVSKQQREMERLMAKVSMNDEEGNYVCGICTKQFSLLRQLRRHLRSHSQVRNLLCVFCGKGFNDAYDLKRHTRTHTGVKPFKCQYCTCAYSQRVILENHLHKQHGLNPSYNYKEKRSKIYICEECGNTEELPEAHFIHLRDNHPNVDALLRYTDRRQFKFTNMQEIMNLSLPSPFGPDESSQNSYCIEPLIEPKVEIDD